MDRSPMLLLRCRESQNNSRFFASRKPNTNASCTEEAAVQRWLRNNDLLVRELATRWFGFFRSLLHIGFGSTKPMLLAHPEYSDDPCSAAVEAVLLKWWDVVRLEMAASDPDIPSRRHYHSLVHVQRMLELVHRFKQDLTRPDALELAVWFRDLVYDPTAPAGQNEEASSQQLRQFGAEITAALEADGCGLHADHVLGREGCLLVSDLMMSSEERTGGVSDSSYFRDFQLSVLAVDGTAYEQYARWVRTEYQHIPMKIYRERRLATIEHLLSLAPPSHTSPPASPNPANKQEGTEDTGAEEETEQLYVVPKLKALWENPARENMAWEFDEMARGVFPSDPMSCE